MESNNISTIATFIAIAVTSIVNYFGYTLDQESITPLILGVITLAIAIWSSRNPNNLEWLGNAPKVDTTETVLNDEYEYEEGEDGC